MNWKQEIISILDKLQSEKEQLLKENASILSLLVSEFSLKRLYKYDFYLTSLINF